MSDEKKILYSGMQATNSLTLGNYLGALKNWVNLNEEFDCFFGVMDLHSLTVRQNPTEFRQNARKLYALYVAAGLDPEVNCVYYQSHVPAHTQLAWILDCFTYMGELNRMTQFKDKSAKHADNINAGLFTYPVLMAADILLYQADLVPVGQDQMQHIEIARDIAQRFNGVYGDVFTVPEGFIPKTGARVMSLQDPTKKMSKSDENPKAYISLMDDMNVIAKKIKSAVTDSEAVVAHREGKDGINNLMGIMSSITGESFESIENRFAGRGYGDFKSEVADVVVECIRPIREKYDDLSNNKDYIEKIYKESAEKANYIANRTLNKVKKKVGFLPG